MTFGSRTPVEPKSIPSSNQRKIHHTAIHPSIAWSGAYLSASVKGLKLWSHEEQEELVWGWFLVDRSQAKVTSRNWKMDGPCAWLSAFCCIAFGTYLTCTGNYRRRNHGGRCLINITYLLTYLLTWDMSPAIFWFRGQHSDVPTPKYFARLAYLVFLCIRLISYVKYPNFPGGDISGPL